jgi:DNA primase
MPRSISKLALKFEREHTSRRPQDLKWLQRIDAQDMLEQLEIENISQATADELVFSCPFPGHSHGDEKPSCYMNDGSKNPALTTVFKCHGCGRAGNAISFVAEHQGISRQKAALELKDHYAPGFRKPKFGSIQKEFEARLREKEIVEEKEIDVIDWSFYHQFRFHRRDWIYPCIEYMQARGFDRRDLVEWNIGYDKYSDRITIPIFNEDGGFVGVKARAYTAGRKPKYLCLGDSEKWPDRYGFNSYEKSLVVFGVHKWKEQERYVFVEGEIDVMSLWKMGIPAICTGGASMSPTQAQIIKEYCDEVVLFLDDDLAGSNAVRGLDKEDGEHKPGIIELLEPFIKVRIVGEHRYDANDYLRRGKDDKVRKLIAEALPSFQLNV